MENYKSKEEKLWDFLIKSLTKLNDNNRTARKIYDKVESLTPILFAPDKKGHNIRTKFN